MCGKMGLGECRGGGSCEWHGAGKEWPSLDVALEQRASPEAPPTRICLQLRPHLQAQPPVSGLGLLPTLPLHSTARYVVQRRPGVRLSLRPEKLVGRVSSFLICGHSCQSWTGDTLAWPGRDGARGWVTLLSSCLLPGTVGFRLPLKLVISATLTGAATYQVCPAVCSALCPQASVLSPQTWDSSGPSQIPRCVPSPNQLLCTSWKH